MVGTTELFDRQVTRNKHKSYSMCSNDMPRLLIRSRLKWWVNPLLAITFLAILVIVVSLLLGSHFFSYFLYRVSAISEKIIAVLYFIPIVAIFALWGLRKVYVYTDRVEVHYPLHLYNNSIITMDDVDAYCIERYWRKSRGSEVEYYRMLLIKGHILWLYVSQENCGNYDDMVSVLKEYFALEQIKAAEQDFYEDTKADALNELSYAYAAKGHWNEAIASINKAIALRPNDAILYDSKGEHLFMSGDTAQAKAMWKKICELDPELSYTKEKHSKLRELIEDIE